MPSSNRRRLVLAVALSLGLLLFTASAVHTPAVRYALGIEGASAPLKPIAHPSTPADYIVMAAQEEVRRGVTYDAAYQTLAYPGGDVKPDRGACTDVVIRALRGAGYDLQQLIHDDMARNFSLYPARYGLAAPDPNIDHRRAPNHIAFLRRHGRELPTAVTGAAAKTWQPGDLVYCKLLSGSGHCGVCSNVRDDRGLPLVIHNCGRTAQEDVLPIWQITGHFRYPPGPEPR
jgi:uncharacterized protein YijF (DUF1287 family)